MKSYIGAKEIQEITGFGYRTCLKIVEIITEQMISEGKPVFRTKTHLVPRYRVLEYLDIKERDERYD